jgi:YegS/Rv2252/BmrU family lipid kinase
MTRIFVIFNPAARGEKSQRLRHFLERKAGNDVTLAPTQRAGEAQTLAARAVADGYSAVAAAGGDGTVNEVINGIGTSGVPLGILPLGTVNVFALELGIPRDLGAAWAVMYTGQTRLIDLAHAQSGSGGRFFAQLAGVGFDARAVRAANWELKKKIGPLAYVWAGLKVLHERPADVEVAADGRTAHGVAVFVGNGRYYGGRFRLFPQARLDDGLLDVCVFERAGYLDVLRYGQGILRATHPQMRGVHHFQASTLACRGATPFELDGEDAGDAPVTFSVKPRALRVIVGETDHA